MQPTAFLSTALALSGLIYSGLCGADTDTATAQDEPTREACLAAIGAARKLADSLPADDASRYFAERDLEQAMTESGNGEFDDCLDYARRATEEVKEHRHVLKPGESLHVRPAKE